MKFRVPNRAGPVGLITIGGGDSGKQGDPLCALVHACRGHSKAKSFAALLAKLRREPLNSDLVGELDAGRRAERVIRHEGQVVDGRSRLLLLMGGSRRGQHRPHHVPPIASVQAD
jgi:hypothetical protein